MRDKKNVNLVKQQLTHFMLSTFFQGLLSGPNTEKMSQHPIFTKLSNMIPFINILILSKFEVIWIIQTEGFHKTPVHAMQNI